MTTFFASYPATNVGVIGVATVQGEGTAGTPTGGVLTIQGDPSGTPVPVSGSISATNPSVGATGAAVPASGTYVAASLAGTLTGLVATANGLKVDGSAVTQPVSGSVTVSGTVAATQSGTWTVQPGNTANTTPWLSTISQGGNSATVSAGGALKVDASASTQPISGTVAATQSGTWTVQPGNTANTTPWLATISQGGNSATVSAGGALKVDASASTQPVSGTVAVTQSTSPWIVAGGGTAGTAASGVVTIQGIASMTPLLVTESPTLTSATFQDGSIAFGSLTTNYQTVVTTGGVVKNVSIRNNTNAVIVVSLDGGSTTSITMDSGDQVSWDLDANHSRIPISTNLQAKYTGSAPTSGSIRINVFY